MKIKTKIVATLLLFTVFACSKEDTFTIPKSNAKLIIDFTFNAEDNLVLETSVIAIINEESKTVTAISPSGIDISALIPTIIVSENATINPIGVQDFSTPIIYTVTAENGSTENYEVIISVMQTQNNAPLDFELIALNDNALEVELLPTFSWNASTDPDGDTVTYDLYLDTDSATFLYAENITETTFEVTERLALLQGYTWKVIAKDSQGAMTSSVTRTFTTRPIQFNDPAVTTNAPFEGRNSHTTVVFNNKLWLIGGNTEGGLLKSDVWFSTNGIDWTEATSDAGFTGRNDHSSIVFDNKLWVIGGFDTSFNERNDVWFSEDGITWTEATNAAPFEARNNHTSLVFDNKIWVIGGKNSNNNLKNDIWFSIDGINWTEVTSDASFTKRANHTSIVFDNKMWVIAGFDQTNTRKNDAWFSTDGITWEAATNNGGFPRRNTHSAVVFGSKMWIIAGFDQPSDLKNDVWFSEDGITWTEITNPAPFDGRESPSSTVFDNKIWTIGGRTVNGKLNDVWVFE